MKKLFALTMIIGFIWALPAMAWEDPCSAVGETYTYAGGYMLTNWTETTQFSPAPDCGGVVTLFCPDSTAIELDYMGVKDTMWIEGIPCHVDEDGDLICTTTDTVIVERTFSKR